MTPLDPPLKTNSLQYTLSGNYLINRYIQCVMAKERELEPCHQSSQQTAVVPSCSTIITFQEWFRLCCRPTYKPRRVKNKGAILVLVCNFLIMCIFQLLGQYKCIREKYRYRIGLSLVAFALTPLIAGWLDDAHFGRYKVIRCSICIMWIATMLATTSSVIAQLVDAYIHIDKKVLMVLLIFMAFGLGGYQANIIQFGLDQLQDASTTEITSFIAWYTWTTISACFTVDFAYTCLIDKQQKIIVSLFVSLSVTLALTLLLYCNHWLIKEPVKENPFRLVYRVLKYALKHKQPATTMQKCIYLQCR